MKSAAPTKGPWFPAAIWMCIDVASGYGNLMLTPEQQATFVEELPEVFVPISGGWGRMGATHIRLASASEDVLAGALRTAWKLRVDKNAKSKKKAGALGEVTGMKRAPRRKR
jgi:hypothetical protein